MDEGFAVNDQGHWEAPLPFRNDAELPDNRSMALNRFRTLEKTLRKKPEHQQQDQEFMDKLLNRGHVEAIPPNELNRRPRYYLPHFAVVSAHNATRL